jgi:hypothetical protein
MTIHLVDQLTIAPHRRAEVLARLRSDYVPLAIRSGLRCERAVCNPPDDVPEDPTHLVVWWELDDVPALWKRRVQALDGPEAEFWIEVAPMLLDRSRRYYTDVDLV